MNDRRRSLLSSTKVNHIPLNYLRSTGTQWINTGIIGGGDISVEISVMFNAPTATAFLFGSRASVNVQAFNLLTVSSNTLRSDYNNLVSVTKSITNQKYLIYKNKNETYADGVSIGTYTYTSFSNARNMYLFAVNTGGNLSAPIQADVYYCKVWNNGVLVRDYIPVIKDTVYCMYDKITKTYFYNQGSGVFSGG